MKEHYLGKTGGTTLLGEKQEATHSVYKNPDADLKKQIAAFEIDRTQVTLGWPEKTWTIELWEGDEAKCTSGKNVSYFKRAEIDEAFADRLEYERNQKFMAFRTFKKAFGVISSLYTDPKGQAVVLKKIDLDSEHEDWVAKSVGMSGRNINTLTVEGYETFYEFAFGMYDGANVKASVSGQMLSLFFNKDGDYVNRDYNEDMTKFKCEDISPDVVMKAFEDKILSMGELEYAKGKYYSKGFIHIPYFYEQRGDLILGINSVPARDDKSYQKWSGETIYKKPAKLEPRSAADLLNDLRALPNQIFKDLFAGKPIVRTEETEEA